MRTRRDRHGRKCLSLDSEQLRLKPVRADGIRSVVRKLIDPHIEPAYRSFCAWRTVMECSDCDTVFRIRFSPGRVLGSFQVGPNLVYAFLLAHHAGLPSFLRDEHLERFKELASQFHGMGLYHR